MKAKNGKFFNRGVKLKDMKFLAKASPIKELPAPDTVYISVAQHIGKSAMPVVAVGDKVLMGQLIAEANGFMSANIFSSVSGEVVSISPKTDERGLSAQYIAVKNDGNYTFKPLEGEVDTSSPESIKKRVAEAGIVGLGGAAFPAAVKYAPAVKVDTLIINGAECEPYLTCDYRVMLERTEDIVKGIFLLKTALCVKDVIIGIEKNKPDCIALFEKYDGLKVTALKERYPMGGEKQLIYCTTGRKVPCGRLPADVGCIVCNVGTALSVYEAVTKNKPLYERVITVSGGAVKNPSNLLVKNGTPYEYIFKSCSVDGENVKMYISGGPMMGISVADLSVTTKKSTSGLLALTEDEVDLNAPTPCISCGKCAAVCPMHLMPMDIDFYTQAGDYASAKKLGGVLNCIECGACAFICPAKRPIVQSVALAKQKIRSLKL